jgi:hypothetical protein
MADGTTARADPDHSATLRTAVTLQNDLHIVVHTLGGFGRSATATVNWTGDSSLLARTWTNSRLVLSLAAPISCRCPTAIRVQPVVNSGTESDLTCTSRPHLFRALTTMPVWQPVATTSTTAPPATHRDIGSLRPVACSMCSPGRHQPDRDPRSPSLTLCRGPCGAHTASSPHRWTHAVCRTDRPSQPKATPTGQPITEPSRV